MKKILLSLGGGLAVFVFSVSFAFAANVSVGNDAISRSITDTRADFAIVDTNHPATANGDLTSFEYYASTTNPFRFLVVDSSRVVKWVSDEITPVSTGVNTFTPSSPAHVENGWNVGMYFSQTGTIPFEYVGALASYTPGGYGVPTINSTLAQDGTSGRTYSFIATGTISCATIDSGTITDVNGNQVNSGYDKYGYNYQAHMFNGFYGNYSRPAEPVTSGDKLIMKWSDAWIANVDCDGDGKLDRGLVDGVVNGTSMGWLTNHFTGINTDGKRYTDFVKIVWVGPVGDLWGQYKIIQEIWNDKSQDFKGLYSKDGSPGLGLNNQWTTVSP